jgi:hypothetical protein
MAVMAVSIKKESFLSPSHYFWETLFFLHKPFWGNSKSAGVCVCGARNPGLSEFFTSISRLHPSFRI